MSTTGVDWYRFVALITKTAERADQKHVNNRSRWYRFVALITKNGCQTSNVWRRNMSRSRESRPRGLRKKKKTKQKLPTQHARKL